MAGVEGRGHRVRGFAPTLVRHAARATSAGRQALSALPQPVAGKAKAAAETELLPTLLRLFASEDGRIGLECFINRTTAEFVGR